MLELRVSTSFTYDSVRPFPLFHFFNLFVLFFCCSEVGKVSVLVPGAGLGRLAFDIAQHGYCCQGNEFSVFMLLGSNFILNQ